MKLNGICESLLDFVLVYFATRNVHHGRLALDTTKVRINSQLLEHFARFFWKLSSGDKLIGSEVLSNHLTASFHHVRVHATLR